MPRDEDRQSGELGLNVGFARFASELGASLARSVEVPENFPRQDLTLPPATAWTPVWRSFASHVLNLTDDEQGWRGMVERVERMSGEEINDVLTRSREQWERTPPGVVGSPRIYVELQGENNPTGGRRFRITFREIPANASTYSIQIVLAMRTPPARERRAAPPREIGELESLRTEGPRDDVMPPPPRRLFRRPERNFSIGEMVRMRIAEGTGGSDFTLVTVVTRQLDGHVDVRMSDGNIVRAAVDRLVPSEPARPQGGYAVPAPEPYINATGDPVQIGDAVYVDQNGDVAAAQDRIVMDDLGSFDAMPPSIPPRPTRRPRANAAETNARAERNRAERERRAGLNARGLCECGESSRPGMKTCQACADRKLQYRRTLSPAERTRRRARRIRAGKCINCGANDVVTGKKYCSICIATRTRKSAEYDAQLRAMALHAYGGQRCSCCGETRDGFLTVEKIAVAEISVARKGSPRFFFNLKQLGYPEGYGVFCHNCNLGRQTTPDGSCPCGHARPNRQAVEPTTTVQAPAMLPRMTARDIASTAPASVRLERDGRQIEFEVSGIELEREQRGANRTDRVRLHMNVVGGFNFDTPRASAAGTVGRGTIRNDRAS